MDEKTLKWLLRFGTPVVVDHERVVRRRAEVAAQRDQQHAEEKRWRAVFDHLRKASDLIGKDGLRGGRLLELPYPCGMSPQKDDTYQAQHGHSSIPVHNTLAMIMNDVGRQLERAARASSVTAMRADQSPKTRTRIMQTAISELDRILRRAGWTRPEIADLLTIHHLWERAPDDFPAPELEPARRYNPYENSDTRNARRLALAKWVEDQVRLRNSRDANGRRSPDGSRR